MSAAYSYSNYAEQLYTWTYKPATVSLGVATSSGRLLAAKIGASVAITPQTGIGWQPSVQILTGQYKIAQLGSAYGLALSVERELSVTCSVLEQQARYAESNYADQLYTWTYTPAKVARGMTRSLPVRYGVAHEMVPLRSFGYTAQAVRVSGIAREPHLNPSFGVGIELPAVVGIETLYALGQSLGLGAKVAVFTEASLGSLRHFSSVSRSLGLRGMSRSDETSGRAF